MSKGFQMTSPPPTGYRTDQMLTNEKTSPEKHATLSMWNHATLGLNNTAPGPGCRAHRCTKHKVGHEPVKVGSVPTRGLCPSWLPSTLRLFVTKEAPWSGGHLVLRPCDAGSRGFILVKSDFGVFLTDPFSLKGQLEELYVGAFRHACLLGGDESERL